MANRFRCKSSPSDIHRTKGGRPEYEVTRWYYCEDKDGAFWGLGAFPAILLGMHVGTSGPAEPYLCRSPCTNERESVVAGSRGGSSGMGFSSSGKGPKLRHLSTSCMIGGNRTNQVCLKSCNPQRLAACLVPDKVENG